jgi:integrase
MDNSIFLTTDLSITPVEVTGDILFSDFYRIYYSDMEGRLKPTTLAQKHAVICDKILPAFGAVPMKDISPQLIRRWQTRLLEQGYSDTYLKTIDMHLCAIFKYAHTYYDLPNPCTKAEHMGTGTAQPMQFWTLQEYQQFIRVYRDQPKIFLAFELLYWCGIRVGELLALTPADIDEKKMLLKITKTYIRHQGQDIISTPKTENSMRNVAMPEFLFQEVMDYVRRLGLKQNERIIPHSSDFLKYHLERGCKKSGVKQIRIHDIRHSHVSLLINQGFSAIAIAERVGHKHISTTLNVYAHLFPNRQTMLVDALTAMHDGTFQPFQNTDKEERHVRD